MSALLRAREETAIVRIADALGFTLIPGRLRADELEEMATMLEGLLLTVDMTETEVES